MARRITSAAQAVAMVAREKGEGKPFKPVPPKGKAPASKVAAKPAPMTRRAKMSAAIGRAC